MSVVSNTPCGSYASSTSLSMSQEGLNSSSTLQGSSRGAHRLGNLARQKETNVYDNENEFSSFHNPWVFHEFFRGSMKNIILWFQAKNLIRTELVCSKCGSMCKMCRRERCLDGFSFRCESGRHEYSIRIDSLFENFRFSIADIILFLINLLDGMTLKQNAFKINVNYRQAAPRWAKIVRRVMANRVWLEYFATDGSAYKLRDLVECDESKFGRKIKANSGCPRGRCVWLMGLVEKKTGRLLLLPIKNR